MELPTKKTPVSKCLDLAAFSARMLSKVGNPVLADLSARMRAAGDDLGGAQEAYAVAVRDILPTRVDVRFAHLMAKRLVVRVQRRAQIADDAVRGPILAQVLPKGARAVARRQGESHVEELVKLEGRLAAAQPVWPEAAAVLAEVRAVRQAYRDALDGRAAAGRLARARRALRDAAKGRFLSTYELVVRLTQAEYPQDRDMQDLFFDRVRTRSIAEMIERDEELPDEDAAEAAEAAAEAAEAAAGS